VSGPQPKATLFGWHQQLGWAFGGREAIWSNHYNVRPRLVADLLIRLYKVLRQDVARRAKTDIS
jgi:hypothetical protein